MPNSLLEALAAGLPTVASRVPGIVEILDAGDPRTLFLDVPTAPAIADAISAAVQNLPDSTNEAVERLPRLPERLTLSAVADQYVGIYHDLCRSPGHPVATSGAGISVSEGAPR
jgi:glycosyltransferase involved in cell wall biosynthesis